MTGFSKLLRAGVLLGTVVASGAVHAAPIVFHTGESVAYGQQDNNWYVGTNAGDYTTLANTYFNGVYTNNNFTSASKWIGGEQGGTNQDYWFTLKIDLTGFDLSTVDFSGFWSSDNNSQLFINGNFVGSRPYPGWSDSSSFSINSGLVAGENLLQMQVFNESGPFGGRLEFTEANGQPVPEPFTMVLGAAGIGLALKRRMKKKSA